MNKPIIGIGSDVLSPEGKRESAFTYLTYVEALKRSGAVPVLIPPQPENAADVIATLDGVLLAGGHDCHPCQTMDARRQNNDLALARAARESNIPALGICLGMQVMNVAAGGTLLQDIDSEVDTEIRHASEPEDRGRHDVMIEQGTRLATMVGECETNVNSSHHQAVKKIGQGLRVTAHAPDGVIEGLEDPVHPFYIGVQWHPEDMNGESSASSIFGAFIEAARKHAVEKRQGSTELSPAATARTE